jgi:hypothetical protein
VGLLRYLISILLTLMPPRYRTEMKLRGAAMVSGWVQMFLAILFVVTRLYVHLLEGSTLPDNVAKELFIKYGGLFMQANEVIGLTGFWLSPINIVCYYFFFEGFVRLMSALAGEHFNGTLPLYAISGVHSLLDKAAYKHHIGELVADLVIRGTGKHSHDLKVYSCRPKVHWNPYLTIEFEGEYYQYFKEEHGAPPRRFVYYLRKQPAGIAAAVIDDYRIDKVLEPEPDKWAGTPGVLDKLLPNWNLPPLAPDEVVRGGPRAGYDLKVYSCRPKDWNTYVTIEFEERWYHLRKDERGPNPRPYIYYLKKAHETRPAVVIKKYKIDDVLREAGKSGPDMPARRM